MLFEKNDPVEKVNVFVNLKSVQKLVKISWKRVQ